MMGLWRRTFGPRLNSGALRFAVATTVVAATVGCAGDGGRTVMKLAHGLDVNHPVHRAMVRMGELVGERSTGQMRIDIYPSEQLCSERECMELIQVGSIAMTKVSAAVVESFIPAFRVFNLPYVFADRDQMFEVLEGPIGRELLLQGTRSRLRGLCYFDAGSRSFYTRERPVLAPSDLEVLHPDKRPFAETVAPMIEEYRAEHEVWPWIERIRASAEDTEGENQAVAEVDSS